MIKIKRKTKRYLVILGLAAVIIILVIAIVRGVGGLIRPSVDTSAGLEYIQEQEAGDVTEIESKISLLEQQDSPEGTL